MRNNHFERPGIDALKKEYDALRASLSCRITEADYGRLRSRLPYITELARIENRSLALYDINEKKFILKVDKHIELLGYGSSIDINDVDSYHALIHPADLRFIYESEIRTHAFLRAISGPEKKDYKLIYDYRVRAADGSYIRFLHQLILFELDSLFHSWIMLVISDVLSKYPNSEAPRRCLLNTKTQKICLFNEELGIKSALLTKRELDVLDLISQGFDSATIADKLFISVSTVNNHRQNILRKTNTNNITQASTYAKLIGIA